MTPGLSTVSQLARQRLTAFAGDEEAELSTGMSDPSASGWTSALGVPVDFLPHRRLKLRQGDKFLAPSISIVSRTICSSLGAGKQPR